MGGAETIMCPEDVRPLGPPRNLTSQSRAARPEAFGHGWDGLHVSSISRAAMPAKRTLGPSRHHMGPSPTQTRTGVQVKDCPDAMKAAARKRGGIA